MSQKRSIAFCLFGALVVMGALLVAGCATTRPPENLACDTDIRWDVASEAQINQFACTLEGDTLTFAAEVQNVSDTPQRFRLNIFLLDQDKAAGHLIPRKGDPPVVAPDQSESVEVPFFKTATMPKQVEVIVSIIE
jgi:hypothetical protein